MFQTATKPDKLSESGILGDMRVRLYQYIGSPQPNLSPGTLLSINPRPILRESGLDSTVSTLPDKADIQSALNEDEYDVPPWSQNVVSHRNRLEGWINGPQLHNRVHVWIGGDMSPGTSPNDPAFFLNHCNVDRIWEAWMASEGREYRPDIGEGTVGHRIDDLMIAILGDALRPSEVLDPSDWYSYDSLSVV